MDKYQKENFTDKKSPADEFWRKKIVQSFQRPSTKSKTKKITKRALLALSVFKFKTLGNPRGDPTFRPIFTIQFRKICACHPLSRYGLILASRLVASLGYGHKEKTATLNFILTILNVHRVLASAAGVSVTGEGKNKWREKTAVFPFAVFFLPFILPFSSD